VKNQTICNFSIIISAIVILTIIPSAFADNREIIIEPISNSGSKDVCGKSLGVDCYTPNLVTIDIGDIVIFSNTDSEPHFFTSGQISDDKIGIAFDSGLLDPNEIFTWSPEVAGKFSYFCPIHPWMQGVINVVQETSENEQEKIPKIPTIDVEKVDNNSVEKVDNNSVEIDVQRMPDIVEIDPEPEFVGGKPIIEKKECAPGTPLTWECVLAFLHLEFSNYLNSVYKIFT